MEIGKARRQVGGGDRRWHCPPPRGCLTSMHVRPDLLPQVCTVWSPSSPTNSGVRVFIPGDYYCMPEFNFLKQR